MSSATILAFAVPYPAVREQGRAQVLQMWGHRDGAIVVPDAGSLTIYRPDGTALLDDVAVDIDADGVASYELAADALEDEALGEGWREEWSLEYDGETSPRVVRREMAVAVRALEPVIGVTDLEEEYPDLEDLLSKAETTRRRESNTDALPVTLQRFVDGAWKRIIRTLIGRGICTYKIFSQYSLADAHRELGLHLAFKHLYRWQGAATGNRFQELYKLHLEQHNAAMTSTLNFTTDADQDGVVDGETRASGGGSIVHVNAVNPTYRRNDRRW